MPEKIVTCYNCFNKIERDEAVKDRAVFFCDWDCRDEFVEKMEKKKQQSEDDD